MADIFESNLFNPTPREVSTPTHKKIKKKNLRNIQTLPVNIPDNQRPGDTSTAISEILDRLSANLNFHFKKYSPLEQSSFHTEQNSVAENSDLNREIQGTHNDSLVAQGLRSRERTHNNKEYGSIDNYKYCNTSNMQNTKFKVLVRLYLGMKERILKSNESDEDKLIEDDDEEIFSAKQKLRERKKQFQNFARRKKESCKLAYTTSLRILETKRKKMSESLKKGCIEWAYSVGNMSPYTFANSGITSVNEFYWDSSQIRDYHTPYF